MMKFITLVGVIGVASAAETYLWAKNNDFSNPTNWGAGVVPTGTVDFANGCIEDFGSEGASLILDVGVEIGGMDFADDMELYIEDDIELVLTGETDNSGQWRCKEPTEYLTSCSENFLVKTLAGWTQADTAPCYSDTIQVKADAVTSIIWGNGQHVKKIEEIDENDNTVASYDDTEAFAVVASNMFQGIPPKINDPSCSSAAGMLTCQMMCADTCPERDLAIAVQDRDDFFSLPEDVRDKVIEDVRVDQDTLNGLRFDATEAFKTGATLLKEATVEVQSEYDVAMKKAGYNTTNSTQPVDVTIAELKMTAGQMANWMEGEGVGSAHSVHYLRHSLTKNNAEKTVNFFKGVEIGTEYYGVVEEPATYKAMRLDDELWAAIDAKGFTRNGRRAVYANVADFIIADANNILASSTSATSATIISFVGPVAVAADDSLDFALAAGGFLVTDVVVRSPVAYVDDDGNFVSGVSPEIIQLAIATSMTRMAMFARAEDLRLAIHFRPTTTWSPTTSPTMSPTIAPTVSPTITPTVAPTVSPTTSPTASADFLASNLLPIAAGGGGGLILIVLIIVICVVVTGGKKDGAGSDPKQTRDGMVVAFENPMYDDPAASSSTDMDQPVNGGLYDEPAFNQNEEPDKENPMYASNEAVVVNDDSGGYLDVQVEDDDDDDEEEEEEDAVEEEEENDDDEEDEVEEEDDDDEEDDEDENEE